MLWFSHVTPMPQAWNSILQLQRAGYADEVYQLTGASTQRRNMATQHEAVAGPEPKLSRTVSQGSAIGTDLRAA